MLLPRFQGVGGPGLPEGDRRVVARLRRDDGRHLAREARRRSVVIAKNRRSLAHTPQVRANGIDIAYESLGRDADPAILMIQGLATPLTGWPDLFGGTNRKCARWRLGLASYAPVAMGGFHQCKEKAPPSISRFWPVTELGCVGQRKVFWTAA